MAVVFLSRFEEFIRYLLDYSFPKYSFGNWPFVGVDISCYR